jgi:hypothetical protein
MNKAIDKSSVFNALKPILVQFSQSLTVVLDTDNSYHLDTSHIMKNKKNLFFGAVQIKKNYVSYHLMPVYVNPALLDSISPALRKRMQGKSCFNFKSVETDLIDELASLTKSGYQFYVEEGYVEQKGSSK